MTPELSHLGGSSRDRNGVSSGYSCSGLFSASLCPFAWVQGFPLFTGREQIPQVSDLPKSSKKAGSLPSCGTDGWMKARALDMMSSLGTLFLCAQGGGSDVSTHRAIFSTLGTRAYWMVSSQINNDMAQCLKAQSISCLFWPGGLPAATPAFPSTPPLQSPVPGSMEHSELSVPAPVGTAAARAELPSAKENPAVGPAPWTPSNRLVQQDLHLEPLSHSRVCFSCWCLYLWDAG